MVSAQNSLWRVSCCANNFSGTQGVRTSLGLGCVASCDLTFPLPPRNLYGGHCGSELQNIIWFTSHKCPFLQLLSFLRSVPGCFLLLISVSSCVLGEECPHHTLTVTQAPGPAPQTLRVWCPQELSFRSPHHNQSCSLDALPQQWYLVYFPRPWAWG